MASQELRMKLLFKRFRTIQDKREEQKKLQKQVRLDAKRIRQLGQEISNELDDYMEAVK